MVQVQQTSAHGSNSGAPAEAGAPVFFGALRKGLKGVRAVIEGEMRLKWNRNELNMSLYMNL
jgi:hypothetical protein